MSEPTTTSSDPGAPQRAAAPDPGEGRRRRLASYSVQNMVWSVLAVGAVVLAWWSLTFNPSESQRRAPVVSQTVPYVVEQAPWPVWVPDPGEGWTPTVVSYEPLEQVQTWHVSYVSPNGEYVALHQAADVTDAWLTAVLGSAVPDGQVALGGPEGEQVWEELTGAVDSNAEHAYLLGPEVTGGSTVVLHGTAGQEEFEELLDTVTAQE